MEIPENSGYTHISVSETETGDNYDDETGDNFDNETGDNNDSETGEREHMASERGMPDKDTHVETHGVEEADSEDHVTGGSYNMGSKGARAFGSVEQGDDMGKMKEGSSECGQRQMTVTATAFEN